MNDLIYDFLRKHRIQDLINESPLNQLDLSRPQQNMPYVMATIIKTVRRAQRNTRGLGYESLFTQFGITEEDVINAYEESYGHFYPLHKLIRFPSVPNVDSKRFVPWEWGYVCALNWGEKGLLKGKKIDGKLFVDKEEWYVRINRTVRKFGVPLWYLLSEISDNKIRTKSYKSKTYINVADVERSKIEFLKGRWMKLSGAAETYNLSRERIGQLSGRRNKGNSGKVRTIEASKRAVYVSAIAIEDTLRNVPTSTAAISKQRARIVLGVDESTMDVYEKSGMFEVPRKRPNLLNSRSVMKLKKFMENTY